MLPPPGSTLNIFKSIFLIAPFLNFPSLAVGAVLQHSFFGIGGELRVTKG